MLFSETLMRAIKEELVTQDSVDYCDPSLMFAIPRLAIVYGLLICQKEGPLNVDRSSAEFPALFLPFKNLLRKIRELLYTLEVAGFVFGHSVWLWNPHFDNVADIHRECADFASGKEVQCSVTFL